MNYELKSTAQEGPVPAKPFYEAVDLTTLLKVLKATPTLKAVFPLVLEMLNNLNSQIFGLFQEHSGTVYCREHKPKQILTTAILVEKGNKRDNHY